MISLRDNNYRDFDHFRMTSETGPAASGNGDARNFIPPNSLKALMAIALLKGLPRNTLKLVAEHIDWRGYTSGAIIVSRQKAMDSVFLLFSGAALVVSHANPARRVLRATLGPGDIFGELSAFDPGPRSSALVAETDCVAGILPAETFLGLISNHEKAALALLQHLTKAVRAANQNVENLCLMDARQRLAFELNRLAKADPGDSHRHRIHPAPTQSEIAETLGVARQTVARLFGEMIRDAIIERRGRTIYIVDAEELKQIAKI